MMDIISFEDDMNMYDTIVPKAANLLSVQLGSLEHLKDFGIDLAFFLDDKYSIQNESFRSYLIETLASHGINVNDVVETLENLYSNITMSVEANQNNTSLIAR